MIALILSIFFVPLMLLIAVAIKCDSRGPIFYLQNRVGKNGKVFKMLKFRTLHASSCNSPTPLREGDPRITRIGSILRPAGLDELPQLLSVLRGEMSLVGPRAALQRDAACYSSFQRMRLAVKPGMTGMAAVMGGHLLTWPQRIRLDIWYIRHKTPLLDFLILMKTFFVIARGRKLYGESGVADPFMGMEVS